MRLVLCLLATGCLSSPPEYVEPALQPDAAPPDLPVMVDAAPAPPPRAAPPPPEPQPDAPPEPDAPPPIPDAAPAPPDVAPAPPDTAPDRMPDTMPVQKPPPPPPCPVRCSDGTCAQTTWNFERVDIGGITASVGSASTLRAPEVRLGASGRALATDVDLAQGQGLTLTVPICDSGTYDARAKILRGSIRIAGPPAQFSITALYPGPVFSYRDPLASAPLLRVFASNVENLPETTEQLRTVTKFLIAVDARVAWQGTIWFDDLQVVDKP